LILQETNISIYLLTSTFFFPDIIIYTRKGEHSGGEFISRYEFLQGKTMGVILNFNNLLKTYNKDDASLENKVKCLITLKENFDSRIDFGELEEIQQNDTSKYKMSISINNQKHELIIKIISKEILNIKRNTNGKQSFYIHCPQSI